MSLSVSDSKKQEGIAAWQKKQRGVPTALANRMLLETLSLFEGRSIEGAPFFEAASHGLKFKKSGGFGGAAPPFANGMLIVCHRKAA